MEWLFATIAEDDLYAWETWIGDWFFVFAAGFLIFEFIRYIAVKKLKWSMIGDAVTNYMTLAAFIAINVFLLAGLYITAYFGAAQFAIFDIPINLATILICIVLADIAYYWEHRFMHRVNAAWATHSVHHSSPFFNISVAYRFGPLDGLWPIFFHLPLVILGFNPFLVFFAEMMVQIYQTALHTEAIKRLPRPFEWIFNTPSHHRVHHGSDKKYLDANYAGIFILWDRLFGTYVREEETPRYGLVRPIPEINSPARLVSSPFVAFFHGFWRLIKTVAGARSFGEGWMRLFGPPDWRPKSERSLSSDQNPAE